MNCLWLWASGQSICHKPMTIGILSMLRRLVKTACCVKRPSLRGFRGLRSLTVRKTQCYFAGEFVLAFLPMKLAISERWPAANTRGLA